MAAKQDGFDARAVPFEHSLYSNTGHELFLGPRPVADEEVRHG
jgi:hypothetical protein